MRTFRGTVFEPTIEALQPESTAKIDAGAGGNTRNLLESRQRSIRSTR